MNHKFLPFLLLVFLMFSQFSVAAEESKLCNPEVKYKLDFSTLENLRSSYSFCNNKEEIEISIVGVKNPEKYTLQITSRAEFSTFGIKAEFVNPLPKKIEWEWIRTEDGFFVARPRVSFLPTPLHPSRPVFYRYELFSFPQAVKISLGAKKDKSQWLTFTLLEKKEK